MNIVLSYFEVLRQLLMRVGPFVALEIALPGGTLFALALYLHRRRKSTTGRSARRPDLPTIAPPLARARA